MHGAWLVPPVSLSLIECFLAHHPGQPWPPVAAPGRNALQYPRGPPRHVKDHWKHFNGKSGGQAWPRMLGISLQAVCLVYS